MIFDRINAWTKARLATLRDERRGRMEVGTRGLRISRGGSPRVVPWSEIAEVDATLSDAFVGDVVALVIRTHAGLVLSAAEHDPEWRALVSGIGDHLPGAAPYASWSLALIGEARSIPIYRRERG